MSFGCGQECGLGHPQKDARFLRTATDRDQFDCQGDDEEKL